MAQISGAYYIFTDGVNGNNNVTISGAQIPTTGVWHHLAFVFDGASTWRYYLDGSQKSTGSFATTIYTNTASVVIGARLETSGYTNGLIDDVRIYNYALSAGEIEQVYQNSNGVFGANLIHGSWVVCSSTACPSISSGLVGWWTMDDAAASTTVLDSSGNGYNGTATANTNTLTTPGVIDGAMIFNGSSQDVSIVGFNPSTTLSSGSYSISMWALSTAATSDGWRPIVGDHSGQILYVGSQSAANNQVNVNLNGASGEITGPFTLNDGNWHHIVAVVVPSKSITVYVDTVSYNSGLTPGASSTTSAINIGTTAQSEYWKGSIDDVRIYSRALSSDEVQMLYRDH
jgi:hypothetical protein